MNTIVINKDYIMYTINVLWVEEDSEEVKNFYSNRDKDTIDFCTKYNLEYKIDDKDIIVSIKEYHEAYEEFQSIINKYRDLMESIPEKVIWYEHYLSNWKIISTKDYKVIIE